MKQLDYKPEELKSMFTKIKAQVTKAYNSAEPILLKFSTQVIASYQRTCSEERKSILKSTYFRDVPWLAGKCEWALTCEPDTKEFPEWFASMSLMGFIDINSTMKSVAELQLSPSCKHEPIPFIQGLLALWALAKTTHVMMLPCGFVLLSTLKEWFHENRDADTIHEPWVLDGLNELTRVAEELNLLRDTLGGGSPE